MPVLTARGNSSGRTVARCPALPTGSLAEAVLVSLDSPSHSQAEPELAAVLQSLRSQQEAEACSVSAAAASASTAPEERRAYHRHSAGQGSSRAPADQQEGHRIVQYVSRRALRRRAPNLSQADSARSFWQQELKPGDRQHSAPASAAAALLCAFHRTETQPASCAEPENSLPEALRSSISAERGASGKGGASEVSRQQHHEAVSSSGGSRKAGLTATSRRAREAQAVMRRALAAASSLAEAGPDVASDKCVRPC